MSLITYSIDESIDEGIPEQPIINDIYPYSSLSPRNFEVLIFLLYKKELKKDFFKPVFTDISLMQGIRDYGRDCCLTRNGKNAGVIQCKNWSNTVSKAEAAKEILKFIFYYFLDKSLIGDLSEFVYYFVSPIGFKDEATEFLNDFGTNIISDQNFSKWINTVLETQSLKKIKFHIIEEDFYALLKSIRIQKIIGHEITELLEQPENFHIQKKFFKIRSSNETELLLNEFKEIRGVFDYKKFFEKKETPSFILTTYLQQ